MKRFLITLLCVFVLCSFCGCGASDNQPASGKINIVTTIFPPYDFARNVGGENVSVTQLLKPGAESHTFEPTPQDILLIGQCDLFIYTGGESDTWIDEVLSSVDSEKLQILRMTDCVDLLQEELKEGMQEEEGEEEEEELDEHVWPSVANASLITKAICEKLCEIDPNHAEEYRKNTEAYTAQLDELDAQYRSTVSNAPRKEIIVADRFPFRYLVHEYGLDYYAAFPGCSEDAEPSANTLAFLINKVKEDRVPVVFYIEFSNEKVCDAVAEVSQARKLMLHSCHNLSQEELDANEDYLSLMSRNLYNLSEALQ